MQTCIVDMLLQARQPEGPAVSKCVLLGEITKSVAVARQQRKVRLNDVGT
jgi:hypothetical protein